YITTFDQSIDVAQKRLEIVKAQQSVGMANNADLFQSQLDLNNLLQLKESQQIIVAQAKTSLLSLLTLRPDSLIAVVDTIIVDRNLVLGDILNSLHQNADIMAAADQIR